jgi:glutamate synthase domain-containing protein 2
MARRAMAWDDRLVTWWAWFLIGVGAVLVAIVVYDLVQRHHALLRNFPLIGHLRYLLEAIGPELRQYIVVDNNTERPFSRDQRRWIYTASKRTDTYLGFGTDNELEESASYLIIKQATFPRREPRPGDAAYDDMHRAPAAKVIGRARSRRRSFRPGSVVNISSMSYGSLGANAVEALNRGAELAGCYQGTGEGGISPYHGFGGELVWQIGTGYFGCRDHQGRFDLARFGDVVEAHPEIRMIEIKLSQGAKPGLGGLLPGAKVTPEVAAMRGIPAGVDCWSPTRHSTFSSADELLDFVEVLAIKSGLPVGIKSAVGQVEFFDELAALMAETGRGVDFITVDGGEGGTGAGPLVFTDHVAFPFKVGFSKVYASFARAGLAQDVAFIGSGRLGLPENALMAFALGCDVVNVGREAMLAIGCIQAQRCHTGRCPTGVTTNSRWRQRGLDPTVKSVRAADYLIQLRKELLQLSRACGVAHPALVTLDHLAFVDDRFVARSAAEAFGYRPGWGVPSAEDQAEIRLLAERAAGI